MNSIDVIKKNIATLVENKKSEYKYIPLYEKPLPSQQKLQEIIELLRNIIFPGFHGDVITSKKSLESHLHVSFEHLYSLLKEQVLYVLQFVDSESDDNREVENAKKISLAFIDKIPELKRLLSTDIKETYDNDPAAKSFDEVIFCYPTIRAVFNHRIAHELLLLGVPIIPRAISELAHSETGIDIHPGAKIGEYFSIDHGTGVVIGETSVIGNHVRLYQGVTLGAKRFVLDEEGKVLNVPRHPVLEDNVVVYANTSILGRITIGRDSIIGGNVWLTNSVAAGSRILQSKATVNSFEDGLGI